mmetsp:Transcript_103918/g.298608  ORF Transcript_103918/g.298608 Transcript_103918/m.298608 type:complete len:211 (-) Transcript_103918:178-810(-)
MNARLIDTNAALLPGRQSTPCNFMCCANKKRAAVLLPEPGGPRIKYTTRRKGAAGSARDSRSTASEQRLPSTSTSGSSCSSSSPSSSSLSSSTGSGGCLVAATPALLAASASKADALSASAEMRFRRSAASNAGAEGGDGAGPVVGGAFATAAGAPASRGFFKGGGWDSAPEATRRTAPEAAVPSAATWGCGCCGRGCCGRGCCGRGCCG